MNKKDIVINFVKDNIKQGKYKPGTKIMSEPMMMEYLGVSRYFVRKAIIDLCKEGIVEKIQGSGTFIKNREKKYIVISTNETYFISEISSFQKQLINSYQTKIEENGYIPIIHLEKNSKAFQYGYTDETDISKTLQVPINEVAGLLSINGNQDAYFTLENNNIPIVLISKSYGKKYPSVIHDYPYYYSTIDNMIKKYKFKNVLFFHYIVHDFIIDPEGLIHYAMDIYYKNNWTLIDIPFSIKISDITNSIDKELKKIKKTPDCIVFLDNTLYINSISLFNKYNKIFKNTKIITQSNNDEAYPPEYDICRLAYNVEDFAEKGCELLFKLISKECPIQTACNIKCNVINEEALK